MNKQFIKSIVVAAMMIVMWPILCLAQAAEPELPSEEQTARYENLTQELRCLVCQNENLADSTAPLAADLRHQVAALIQQNKSDSEIKNFLTQRFGEFILFKPSVSAKNFLLWFAPFLLTIWSLIYLCLRIKKQSAVKNQPLSEIEKQKLNELLK